MEDIMYTVVPRRLRVRGTVMLGQTRVPIRAFLVLVGFAFLAAIMLILGASVTRTVVLLLPPLIGTIALLEGTWGGRTSIHIIVIFYHQITRPKRLRLAPVMLSIPTQVVPQQGARTARWVTHQQGEARGHR